jgi:hypothetical protein
MISCSFTHIKYFMCMVSPLSPEIVMNLNMAFSLHVYIFFSQIQMHNGDIIPYVKYTTASLHKLTATQLTRFIVQRRSESI